MDFGKKIKLFLVEKDISQKELAKVLNLSDSIVSDKLNGKTRITVDEFYMILCFINQKSEELIDANYFIPFAKDHENF